MPAAKSKKSMENDAALQRPAAETLYADELQHLLETDQKRPKPPGWHLSPMAVLDFVLGNDKLKVQSKFIGRRGFVECCVAALATNRGLMLIGEPGTAKSYLSELLAAAVSGDSTLTIQGSAGTTEDQIKYSWNYALLLAEGPTEQSLVPAPLFEGMQHGKLVRFEEITRCPLEMQDTLLSILSDRVMHIPELKSDTRVLFARQGFNLIATANTLDRGVNEMSAALKRRFNFETVQPIADIRDEMQLVQRETGKMLEQAGIPLRLPEDKTEVLVSTFHELRNGMTADGKSLEPMSTVLSTAEAVSVGFQTAVQAYYYHDGKVAAEHFLTNMIGSAFKDNQEDLKKLQHYFSHVAARRKGKTWQEFAGAKHYLEK